MTGPRPAVRTVLGDVPGAELGICDAHDHLFIRSTRLPGQELADPEAAEAELRAFRALGGGTMVQWTPYGLGRAAGRLPALSRATGVRLVAATGMHQAEHYRPGTVEGVRDRLAELFTDELTRGIGGTGPRAGLIKVAGGFHGLDAHARHTMTAAAEAHHRTDAPIAVHLELGTAAPDVLDLLCGELGVPPHRVLIGHLNRSPDPVVHLQVAAMGAFLVYDGPSRAHHTTDWRLPEVLTALVEAGHAGQLLLGGDTTTAGARSVNGGPGLPYLLRRLRPRLELAVGAAVMDRILIENPARALAVNWPD
ncbi:phosphotriesterase family protein [Streptomyces cucumeris]|uniref:phosphotriesterase family protein n=1 Tax=Streptomyces cucumeris TaxID=2962890 RepID=UPI003D7402C8